MLGVGVNICFKKNPFDLDAGRGDKMNVGGRDSLGSRWGYVMVSLEELKEKVVVLKGDGHGCDWVSMCLCVSAEDRAVVLCGFLCSMEGMCWVQPPRACGWAVSCSLMSAWKLMKQITKTWGCHPFLIDAPTKYHHLSCMVGGPH